jgi:hypothetical protein
MTNMSMSVRSRERLLSRGLTVYVKSWLNVYGRDLGLRQLKLELLEIPRRKLIAWYETSRHVIDIAVWEEAYCLGIMVLDKQTDSMIYAVGGACENDDEVYGRLDAFARWLSAHQEKPIFAAALEFPQQVSAA